MPAPSSPATSTRTAGARSGRPRAEPARGAAGAAGMSRRPPFPFPAIVGQAEMKLAILVAAVDPGVGGVLVFGDRGTGKSTAIRALAALLPEMPVVEGCPYSCDPADLA